MKILLVILALLIPNSVIAKAESIVSGDVENIDLNIKGDQAAVTFLDLSDGEVTLVQGPDSKSIVISDGAIGTLAELEGWLALYDVKDVTTLFLTKNNQEMSFSKISQLISKYHIKEIVTTSEISQLLVNNLQPIKQLSIVAWGEGTKKDILPAMTAEVQYVGNQKNEGMDLMLNFYKYHIFMMTSSSLLAEQTFLKKNLRDVHVFKLPNRMNENSISKELIQTLNPQISILSLVEEGQLAPDLLKDLQGIWSEVYLPKKHGTVTIKFNESNYEVITIPQKEE